MDPDGAATIDSLDALGFGLLIANDNVVIALEDLGLEAGFVYTFSQDMRFDPTLIDGFAGGTVINPATYQTA